MTGDFYIHDKDGLWFSSGETGEVSLVRQRPRMERALNNARAKVARTRSRVNARDKRIKQREGVYASRYPAALRPLVDEAIETALIRAGINPTDVLNLGEGVLRPKFWEEQ